MRFFPWTCCGGVFKRNKSRHYAVMLAMHESFYFTKEQNKFCLSELFQLTTGKHWTQEWRYSQLWHPRETECRIRLNHAYPAGWFTVFWQLMQLQRWCRFRASSESTQIAVCLIWWYLNSFHTKHKQFECIEVLYLLLFFTALRINYFCLYPQ